MGRLMEQDIEPLHTSSQNIYYPGIDNFTVDKKAHPSSVAFQDIVFCSHWLHKRTGEFRIYTACVDWRVVSWPRCWWRLSAGSGLTLPAAGHASGTGYWRPRISAAAAPSPRRSVPYWWQPWFYIASGNGRRGQCPYLMCWPLSDLKRETSNKESSPSRRALYWWRPWFYIASGNGQHAQCPCLMC